MKRLITVIFFLSILHTLFSQESSLSLRWKVLDNNYQPKNLNLSELEIKNIGKQPLDGSWSLFFNSVLRLVPDSSQAGFTLTHKGGDYYKLTPGPGYAKIPAGKSMQLRIFVESPLLMLSDFPSGAYFIVKDQIYPAEIRIASPPASSLTPDSQDRRPFETPASRYYSNSRLSLVNPQLLPPFLPTPQTYIYGEGKLMLPSNLFIRSESVFEKETSVLISYLDEMGFKAREQGTQHKGSPVIRLEKISSAAGSEESYEMIISRDEGILLKASSQSGIFNAIQGLRSVLLKHGRSIPELFVIDYPRFSYRGLHLDVARNFQKKETLFQLLDWMALYKLNKLHLHLTDDEGWRIEINGLPELTTYGGFRGHTENESDHLQPSWGSGPYNKMALSSGCGFYNRTSFIEILRYAANLHIEVIPEIEFPGHARAAIKAMDYRYRRLIASGNKMEATEYLLRDTNDVSVYTSVQGYHDNVVDVCTESVYHFIRKVVGEISAMYLDAGLNLKMIHLGGDEVPPGAWEGSPACRAFLSKHTEYEHTRELSQYFFQRVNDLLALKNISMAGWEEVVLQHRKEPGSPEVNETLGGRDIIPFCWTFPGSGEQPLSNKIANAGFRTVIARANALYLDMAYAKDPAEPGFRWANYLNTEEVFGFSPLSLPGNIVINKSGDTASQDRLIRQSGNFTDLGKQRIQGVEACLWGENIRNPELLEYMLFPRLIAVAERAWAQAPGWEQMVDSSARSLTFLNSYNTFANMLGQKELPMLDRIGIRFRLPLPGTIVENGITWANVEFPGLVLRYTNDNRSPSANSNQFDKAVQSRPGMKIATVMPSGRTSRVIQGN